MLALCYFWSRSRFIILCGESLSRLEEARWRVFQDENTISFHWKRNWVSVIITRRCVSNFWTWQVFASGTLIDSCCTTEYRVFSNLNAIESEYHFIIECPLYETLRETLISLNFANKPSERKFIELLKITNPIIMSDFGLFSPKSF